jgi:hypothetical protein
MEQLRRGGNRAGLASAQREVLAAERALAASRGLEYAVPLEGLPPADDGAPLPHMMAAGGRVILAYYVSEPGPQRDGTYVGVIDPADGSVTSLAVVEFSGYLAVRTGMPNDEALHGHPLYGRGLEFYSMHLVVNSSWIAEMERINSVHRRHRGGWHQRLKHYLFTFHDEVFECVAESHHARREHTSMRALLERLATELIEGG